MEIYAKLLPNILAFLSLLVGGAFFKFVLDILKWRKLNRDESERRDRLYEIAFRRADAHGKQITQYAVAVASSHYEGKFDLRDAFLEILVGVIGYRDESGAWKMREYPDFLTQAKEELKLLESDEKQTKERETP